MRMTLDGQRFRNANENPNTALVAKLEASAHQFATEHPEEAMWIHDHLHKIDFHGFQNAFKKVIESVNGTYDSKRVVPPERTYIVMDDTEEGHFYDEIQSNTISGSLFLDLKELSPLEKMARLLDLVCHENAHATGRISHVELSENISEWKVGYASTATGSVQSSRRHPASSRPRARAARRRAASLSRLPA